MNPKLCERCGKKIPKQRLKILPDTRLCVKCSEITGGYWDDSCFEETKVANKKKLRKK